LPLATGNVAGHQRDAQADMSVPVPHVSRSNGQRMYGLPVLRREMSLVADTVGNCRFANSCDALVVRVGEVR
jgi:hypothetical protein